MGGKTFQFSMYNKASSETLPCPYSSSFVSLCDTVQINGDDLPVFSLSSAVLRSLD